VPAERALFGAEPARHRALAVAGPGAGFADKAVTLFLREAHGTATVSPAWVEAWPRADAAALAALEADRAGRPGPTGSATASATPISWWLPPCRLARGRAHPRAP